MSETLLVEGIPVSTVDAPPAPPETIVRPQPAMGEGAGQVPAPAPEPQTQTSGPQEPPQAPPEAPNGGGEPGPPQPILETAFVVYMNPQGHWMIAADVHSAAEMQIARPPNVDDFFYGCSMVVKDIHVQETAATAVAMQQQALTQMAENARQAAMTQQINQALGPNAGAGGAIDLSTLGRGRP